MNRRPRYLNRSGLNRRSIIKVIGAASFTVATPHGRLHFCGEHTAVSNRGMEGAMESGERVALEVMDSL